MTIKSTTKTYKYKLLVWPLVEIAWMKPTKILSVKLGIWKWTANINFNF